MSEPSWMRFLTERDKAVFAAAGYGARAGFGKRPALLVVDVNYNFCGDKPEPILQSIKRWRNSCGEEAWIGVKVIQTLLQAARAKGLPVIYSTGVERADKWDHGGWGWKNDRRREQQAQITASNLNGNTIVPEIAPAPQDIVIEKQKPSAFFSTSLLSYLILLGADSVIIAGTTTSGCVRATTLDAFSNNLRCAVVEDACFDRSEVSHAVSLCDMNAKYADVVNSAETLTFINGLPNGLFELPRGTGAPKVAAAE